MSAQFRVALEAGGYALTASALSPAGIASPEFIGDLPKYCGFFTYTMFLGRVGSAR